MFLKNKSFWKANILSFLCRQFLAKFFLLFLKVSTRLNNLEEMEVFTWKCLNFERMILTRFDRFELYQESFLKKEVDFFAQGCLKK